MVSNPDWLEQAFEAVKSSDDADIEKGVYKGGVTIPVVADNVFVTMEFVVIVVADKVFTVTLLVKIVLPVIVPPLKEKRFL